MPNSPSSDLVKRTHTYPLQQLGFAFDHPRWPYGYGIGTTTLGGQYVVRIMHASPTRVGVENGYGNLLVELGIVGLILWIVLGLSISISAWRVVKELRGTPWFPLAFAIFLYAVLLFFPMMYAGVSPYQDFVLNAWLWVLLGILYRLQMFPKAVEVIQVQAVPRQG
jgi:O-antigen ligase